MNLLNVTLPVDTATVAVPPADLPVLLRRIADQAAVTDADGDFPADAFRWLAAAGLLSVTLPGHDLDQTRANTAPLLQLLKRIGAANLAVGRVYEGHVNALQLIRLYAKPEQQQRWFANATDHLRLFSVWNTQADNGIRIHALDDGRYRLEGAKTFCSGAGWVSRPLITGELIKNGQPQGWQMVIVPTETVREPAEDRRFWQPLGMRASASFRLDFTGVELTDADLLGQPNDYYRQPYFSGGAIRFAAVQLGAAEALFDATRGYLSELNRTNDVFQQTRLAEMAYLIESGNQWINMAGTKTDQWIRDGADAAKIVAYANMTRTAIEEVCLRVMPLAEKSVGARGLMRPLPFERIHRDLTFYLRQPAPDATLTDIGRYALTHPDDAHDLWK